MRAGDVEGEIVRARTGLETKMPGEPTMTAPKPSNFVPLGSIEPHAALLNIPTGDQSLYKMMTIENLLRSIKGEYLHFNRVDSYADFPGVDPHDGEQLPQDRLGNARITFIKNSDFSSADYYDQSRARTYACCFSLTNSDAIWKNYAAYTTKGKVCVIFDFCKLRATLNRNFEPGNSRLIYNGVPCYQIFSVNYGVVDYIEWDLHLGNAARLQNPIKYTYWKSAKFRDENEFRISLSAAGIGKFALDDGNIIDFPASLQAPLDFRMAITDGTIKQILAAPNCDTAFLQNELEKLGIMPAPGSDPSLR
jgi:hypothetical protein